MNANNRRMDHDRVEKNRMAGKRVLAAVLGSAALLAALSNGGPANATFRGHAPPPRIAQDVGTAPHERAQVVTARSPRMQDAPATRAVPDFRPSVASPLVD